MKPKTEFSKKLLYVNYTLVIIVIIAAFILMWRSNDLSPLYYIITGLFAEVTAATSFYYWKAKNENMIKIRGDVQENECEMETETETETDIP